VRIIVGGDETADSTTMITVSVEGWRLRLPPDSEITIGFVFSHDAGNGRSVQGPPRHPTDYAAD
jgi:hypothetical protein